MSDNLQEILDQWHHSARATGRNLADNFATAHQQWEPEDAQAAALVCQRDGARAFQQAEALIGRDIVDRLGVECAKGFTERLAELAAHGATGGGNA